VSIKFEFNENEFNRHVRKTMQSAMNDKAAEIGREVQSMFDRVLQTHKNRDVDSVERELIRQWHSLLGQKAERGSLRDAAEAIASGERATVETNVVWQ
jgi:hypothetical protein